jgi:hypothetical protein
MTGQNVELATEAFIYGYPLVFDLEQVIRLQTEGLGSLAPAPFNEFSHAHRLAGPKDTNVCVNNDTVYSTAQLNLTGGPLLLHVPNTSGAYYVLQFVDAWTNNFAYVGRRATGTDEATYLITPPGWDGLAPAGMRVISAPTVVASIVGRFACDGPADLPRVQELQRQLTITPTSGNGRPQEMPRPEPGVPENLRFFERMRVWMTAFPPSDADQRYQQRFAPLGLLDRESPYFDAPAELVEALTGGLAAAKAKLEEASRAGSTAKVNGWSVGLHLFDYNADHLGIGTLDDPDWIIDDRQQGYLARALAARIGLWGNHAYEAVYCVTYTDEQGRQLNGARSYTLRFEQPPPVDAFWSLTMYDLPDYFLVDNPINRYSIGDRTPGLRHEPDGSLIITMSRERPADDANWLPTPDGDFRPMLRLYQPRAEILHGDYQLPRVTASSGG